jgi:hypothetical protein
VRSPQRIEVLVKQADCAPGDRAGVRGDAVAARHGVEGDVDQLGGGATDHVGPHATPGELNQVWQMMQLADDDLGGRPWRSTGP